MVFGQDLQEIPADLNFSCDGREYGYYADPATNCQVFHICLGDGDIKWSFLCPNQTIFNQVIISTKNSLHTEFQNPKKCIVLKINSSFFFSFFAAKMINNCTFVSNFERENSTNCFSLRSQN